jgi:signal recognition particle GTPase
MQGMQSLMRSNQFPQLPLIHLRQMTSQVTTRFFFVVKGRFFFFFSETKSYFTTKFFSQVKDSIQQSFTGNKVLTKNDLTILLEEMKTKFLSRNVAADMVSQLIDSVEESLIGTKTNSFQSVKAAVYDVFHATLERILSQQW